MYLQSLHDISMSFHQRPYTHSLLLVYMLVYVYGYVAVVKIQYWFTVKILFAMLYISLHVQLHVHDVHFVYDRFSVVEMEFSLC